MRRWFPALRFLSAANLVTSLGAVAGLGSMAAGSIEAPRLAFTLLGGALLCDRLDGPVARRRGESSPFGAQLDSLADTVSFVAAPAVLALQLHLLRGLGVAAGAVYALAGLWRLAYFNVHGMSTVGAARYFTGIPTTEAAAWFTVLGALWAGLSRPVVPALFAADFVLGAVFMLANLRYPKDGIGGRILLGLVPAALLLMWVKG